MKNILFYKINKFKVRTNNSVPIYSNVGPVRPVGPTGPTGPTGLNGIINPNITITNNLTSLINPSNITITNSNGYISPVEITGMVWKGDWTETIEYIKNDVVYYNGSSYIALITNINIIPNTNMETWNLIAKGIPDNQAVETTGMVWKGDWNETIIYINNDVVYYNGSSYIALITNINIIPTTDILVWNLVAKGIPDDQPKNSLGFGNFYGMVPDDYPNLYQPNTPIDFPNDIIVSGSVARYNSSSFLLIDIGTYQIQYQIAVKDANKIIIGMENLDSLGTIFELPYTVMSKNTVDSFFIN